MSKLLLVTSVNLPDHLLMLVPDVYAEEGVYETAGKNDMGEIEIHEARLTDEFAGTLRDMGMTEWREYWG